MTNRSICMICLDDASGDQCPELNCQHKFHFLCITQWMRHSDQCPLCRGIIDYVVHPDNGTIVVPSDRAVHGRRQVSREETAEARQTRDRDMSATRRVAARDPNPRGSLRGPGDGSTSTQDISNPEPTQQHAHIPPSHSWCLVPLIAAAQGQPHPRVLTIAQFPSFRAAVDALRRSSLLMTIRPDSRPGQPLHYSGEDQNRLIDEVAGTTREGLGNTHLALNSPLTAFMQEAFDYVRIHPGAGRETTESPAGASRRVQTGAQPTLPPHEIRNMVWREMIDSVRNGSVDDAQARIAANRVITTIDAWEQGLEAFPLTADPEGCRALINQILASFTR